MTNEEFIKSISEDGEEWRNVTGYEKSYLISNYGKLISIKRKTPIRIKSKISTEGYEHVALSLNGKIQWTSIHRLVALMFIPNPENKPQVDHIDRNRSNNIYTNLRWCTGSENMLNPLTRKILRLINKGRERIKMHKPVVCLKNGKVIHTFYKMNLCEQFGFERSAVTKCCKHKKKTYKGYEFLYLDEYQLLYEQSK